MIVIKHQGNFFFVALASIDVDFCSMHRTFYWTLLLITSIIIDSIFLVLSTLQLSKFERQWTRIKTTWKCKANKDEPAKHQIFFLGQQWIEKWKTTLQRTNGESRDEKNMWFFFIRFSGHQTIWNQRILCKKIFFLRSFDFSTFFFASRSRKNLYS